MTGIMQLTVLVGAVRYNFLNSFHFVQQFIVLGYAFSGGLNLIISFLGRLYVMVGVKQYYMEYVGVSVKIADNTPCAFGYRELHHWKLFFIIQYFIGKPVELLSLNWNVLCAPVNRMAA